MSITNNSDAQLDRMKYLMEFRTPKAQAKSNLEYSTLGADGKAYGIIKEGTMYYIMTTTPEKRTLKESYEYIGGFNYRKEHGYKSYNEATKHLELMLMECNKANGVHKDVSVFDNKKQEKDMTVLTEEARKELNRMHQILENANKICAGKLCRGCTDDPESKGKATDVTKQGAPFGEEAKAELDKDVKLEGTVEKANKDNVEIKDVDKVLTKDEKTPESVTIKNDYTDAKCDIEGTCVATEKPKGAKAIKMNESFEEDGDTFSEEDFDFDTEEPAMEPDTETVTDTETVIDTPEGEITDVTTDVEDEDGLVGFEDDSNELESMLEEFEEDMNVDTEEVIDECGDKKTLKEGENIENVKAKDGGEEILKGPKTGMKPISWEKMEKTVTKVTDMVMESLKKECAKPKKKETLQEAVDRLVKEEVTRLNAWGKHPRYQKPAFTTPANTEVDPNGVNRSWDDDSVKGDKPYGTKIGKSDPFTEVVDLLTDSIVSTLKESKKNKRMVAESEMNPAFEQFDWVGEFENGYAPVTLNNKFNVVSEDGRIVFDKWFNNIWELSKAWEQQNLNEGIARKARKNNKKKV